MGGNAAPADRARSRLDLPGRPGVSATLARRAARRSGGAGGRVPVRLRRRLAARRRGARVARAATPGPRPATTAPRCRCATRRARSPAARARDRHRARVPPGGARPTAARRWLCDGAARRVWIVNPDHDTVAALDADRSALELETPVCDEPRASRARAAGEIWVACSGDDRLRVLDAASGAPRRRDPDRLRQRAGGHRRLAPAGTTVFVTLRGRRRAAPLRRRDPPADRRSSRSVRRRAPRGDSPTALASSSPASSRARDHGEVWEVAAGAHDPHPHDPSAQVRRRRQPRRHRRRAAARRTSWRRSRSSPDGVAAWVVGTKPNVERGPLIGPDLDSDNTVRSMLVEHRPRRRTVSARRDRPRQQRLARRRSPSRRSATTSSSRSRATTISRRCSTRFELDTAAGLGALRHPARRPAPRRRASASTARPDAPSSQDFLGRSVHRARDRDAVRESATSRCPARRSTPSAGEPLPRRCSPASGSSTTRPIPG